MSKCPTRRFLIINLNLLISTLSKAVSELSLLFPRKGITPHFHVWKELIADELFALNSILSETLTSGLNVFLNDSCPVYLLLFLWKRRVNVD